MKQVIYCPSIETLALPSIKPKINKQKNGTPISGWEERNFFPKEVCVGIEAYKIPMAMLKAAHDQILKRDDSDRVYYVAGQHATIGFVPDRFQNYSTKKNAQLIFTKTLEFVTLEKGRSRSSTVYPNRQITVIVNGVKKQFKVKIIVHHCPDFPKLGSQPPRVYFERMEFLTVRRMAELEIETQARKLVKELDDFGSFLTAKQQEELALFRHRASTVINHFTGLCSLLTQDFTLPEFCKNSSSDNLMNSKITAVMEAVASFNVATK